MKLQHALGLAAAVALAASGPPVLQAQAPATLPLDSIALNDLAAFSEPPGNWRIVGGVAADRARNLRVTTSPGSGVVVNTAKPGDGGDLRTTWEHGDIDLELEFMVPRASNSGIYFQGRYELQLLDSWGVEHPTYGDVGGIYERWDESRGPGNEGFEGHAPRFNAARAPGLWQTLRVEFRAPRFDASGNKIENARFVRVELNGAVIHENVELSGPTRGAFLPGEAATGPLIIQGDHGPIAFRKIRFKRYGAEALELSGLTFKAYDGKFQSLPDLTGRSPDRSGESPRLTASNAGVADAFALVEQGTIEVPVAGRYLFDLRLGWIDGEGGNGTEGGARLRIGGREVLVHDGRQRSVTAEADLAAGRQEFLLELFKNREGRPASVDLFAEGPGVRRQALTSETRTRRGSAQGAVTVEPGREPYLLRSFLEHGGEKRTHVISVGDPSGVHYSYDAELGNVLLAWRGPFLETSQMWVERGEPQLAVPLGSVVRFALGPALATLNDENAAWPDSIPPSFGFRFLGYDLDEGGLPTFRYRAGEATVEDRIQLLEGRRGLARSIRIDAPAGGGGLYLRLARGESIERTRDGAYIVDGRFYLVPGRGAERARLRSVEGGQELIVPLSFRRNQSTAEYEVIW